MGKIAKKNSGEDAKTAPPSAREGAQAQAEAPGTKKQRTHPSAGFRRRMIALAIITGVLFLIFLLRLAQFQLVDGGQYRAQAEGGAAPATSQSGEDAPGPPGERPPRTSQQFVIKHKITVVGRWIFVL